MADGRNGRKEAQHAYDAESSSSSSNFDPPVMPPRVTRSPSSFSVGRTSSRLSSSHARDQSNEVGRSRSSTSRTMNFSHVSSPLRTTSPCVSDRPEVAERLARLRARQRIDESILAKERLASERERAHRQAVVTNIRAARERHSRARMQRIELQAKAGEAVFDLTAEERQADPEVVRRELQRIDPWRNYAGVFSPGLRTRSASSSARSPAAVYL